MLSTMQKSTSLFSIYSIIYRLRFTLRFPPKGIPFFNCESESQDFNWLRFGILNYVFPRAMLLNTSTKILVWI